MANTPITMSKLRQALKQYSQGKKKLQISTATGLSRTTVKKYIAVLESLATTWEEISRLSDKDLDDLFCKEPPEVLDARLMVLHAFFAKHDKDLRQRGMTRGRLYAQYARDNEAGFKVTSFYKHYRLWKRRAAPSMHIEHTPGDKVFVDFTGEKLSAVDTDTGEIVSVEVFVAILGASQMTYVEAVVSQKVEDFIACCEHALHFFGGAPNAIVPDNLKSAVIKSNRYEPKLNENFEAFADHYSMTVLPARAYKPKDKALVEGAVKITYNKIFTGLPKDAPMSLAALNDAIRDLLWLHNSAKFKGRTYSRMEQFLDMEQATLQPLPERRYEVRRSLQATVMKNGHVCLSVDKHYYSVPYAYISKKMRVLYSASFVEIFYKYEVVATHARIRTQHGYTTDDKHLASHHKARTDWSEEFFLNKAKVIGADVELYIRAVLRKKTHPEQAYKSCQGILSFAHRVGHERFNKACRRANAFEIYSYRAIEDILKKGLEDDDLEPEQLTMPTHENIRGSDYFKQQMDEQSNNIGSPTTGVDHE